MRCLLSAALMVSASSLFAQSTQSEAEAILEATQGMPASSGIVFHVVPHKPAATSAPPVQNIFTTLSPFVSEPVFVPCFDCITGAVGPTVGIAMPDGNVSADGASQYNITNYFLDNSYSGTCDVAYLVRDAAGDYIFKSIGSLGVEAGESIISGGDVTLANNPAYAGVGSVLTVTKCGATAGVTGMQITVTNP